MNGSDNNFQDVKRLLKLKRHEVPPPGYFNNFSGNVISRIRAGEAQEAESFSEKLKQSAPWMYNFLRIFEAKPAFVGAGATMVCLVLVFGLVLTEHSDTPGGTFMTASSQAAQTSLASAEVTSPTAAPLADPLASSGIAINTNPVTSLQPVAAAFGQPGMVSLFQSAGFSPSGNGN